MRLKLFASMGLVAAAFPANLLAQDGAADPQGNWAAIVQCGAIEGAEARHDCVDDVLRRAGVLSPERIAREARQEFGREPRETRSPASQARSAPDREEAASAEADELLTTIKEARIVGYNLVRVTTADGTVWEQTQARSFTSQPKPGDAFSVVRAALGSYLCRFGNSSRYRCERVD